MNMQIRMMWTCIMVQSGVFKRETYIIKFFDILDHCPIVTFNNLIVHNNHVNLHHYDLVDYSVSKNTSQTKTLHIN